MADPLDIPLPADVKVGHVVLRRGVSLKHLVAAAQRYYDLAIRAEALRSPHPQFQPPLHVRLRVQDEAEKIVKELDRVEALADEYAGEVKAGRETVPRVMQSSVAPDWASRNWDQTEGEARAIADAEAGQRANVDRLRKRPYGAARDLPPLPEPLVVVRDTDDEPEGGGWIVDCDCEGPLSYSLKADQALYTAEQMEAYARGTYDDCSF
jgi:hypothetical protein